MQQWSPFWRWLAAGVLAVMTIAWVARAHDGGRGIRGGPSHVAPWMQHGPAAIGSSSTCANGTGATMIVASRDGQPAQQVCINVPGATVSVGGDGNVAVNGSGAVNQDPRVTAALQRQRAQLQQQEGQLQQQQAQLSARMAALQARLTSLGQ